MDQPFDANTINKSKNLTIKHNSTFSLFIISWNNSDILTMDDFKSEMLEFKKTYKEFHPKSIIWLQESFTTNLSMETHEWTEETINKYCFSKGLQKVAFVVGKNLMAHLGVVNFFNNIKSCLEPKHFAEIGDALNWIMDVEELEDKSVDKLDIEIKYLGKTENGKSQFSLETNTKNTESTLNSFNHLLRENAFLKKNAARFYSLTKREKEVFQLYAKGETLKDIGEKLFLSEFTVRTHWRNAKKKLAIKTLSDIADYRNSFLK